MPKLYQALAKAIDSDMKTNYLVFGSKAPRLTKIDIYGIHLSYHLTLLW